MSEIRQDNFEEIRPKRSMSYNDLKKRRLLRSSKSKSKLQKFQCDYISKTQRKTPQTQCKSTITITTNHQNIIQNCIKQVKNTLSQIKQTKTKSIKQIISKQFYTDRTETAHPKYQLQKKINQKLSFYDKNDYIKQEKEVIKSIIMKKKSQRRLLRYSEIREEVKKSKSKSNDNSDEKKQKKDNDTTISIKKDHILKSQKNNQTSNSAKKIRAKKFQLVPETSYMTERPTVKQAIQTNQQIPQKDSKNKQIFKSCSRRKLKKSISHIIIKTKIQDKQKNSINFESLNMKQELANIQKLDPQSQNKILSPPKKQQINLNPNHNIQLKNNSLTKNKVEIQEPNQKKQKQQKQNKLLDYQNNQENQNEKPINISGISSIQQKRNNSNLESCLDIVQELQYNEKAFLKTNQADDENCSNMSNILNLLVLPTTQLKIKLTNNKNGKRKHDLQKFKKVFPKNFFKS